MKSERLIAAVIVTALAAFGLARVPYVPREPLAVSREFVERIQAGDLADAYRLTNQGADVGRTPDAFEANVRHELGIEAFPVDRSITLIGAHGAFQSYGNRLRRCKRIDPGAVFLVHLECRGIAHRHGDLAARERATDDLLHGRLHKVEH